MSEDRSVAVASRSPGLWARARGFATSAPTRRTRMILGTGLGAVWTAFLLLRLLVPDPVGLADETDGHRYTCQRGLQAIRPIDFFALYNHIYTTYRKYSWYGEQCGTYRGDETKYASSFEAVLWLGEQLNGLFGMPGALDLRTLAILYGLVIGLAIGLTFVLLPGSVIIRLLTTIGIGLVYTESVIAVYFVSPYAEPVVWCGFALLLPALLWYWRAPKISWPRLALVVGLTFLIITAKNQAIGYLPAILIALVWRSGSPVVGGKRTSTKPRWTALRSRGRSITACVLLLAGTVGYVGAGGNLKVYSELNVYVMVFTTLLPAGDDPEGDLIAMGANPALAYANGTTVNGPEGAADDPRLLEFSQDVTQLTVLKFIATHPTRLIPLTTYGLRAMGAWRPSYLGNFTDTPAHPGLEYECRVCVYYQLLTPVRSVPYLFGFILVFALAVGLRTRYGGFIPERHRVMGKVTVFFAAATFGEFWFILLAQGVGDDVKHHVFTLLPMMLCIPTALSCIALGRRDETVAPNDDASEDTALQTSLPTVAPAAALGS